jgi:apolipoprotein D and lipocalin family protein
MKNKLMLTAFSLLVKLLPSAAQEAVGSLDTARFAGKWYVLASVPIYYEKDWCCITEAFRWSSRGYYDVETSYKNKKGGKKKVVEQRLKPVPESGFAKYSADQWILKTYYWIFKVPEDYSYAIAGHPDKTYIYLLSREVTAPEELYTEFNIWCRENGFDAGKVKKILHEEPGESLKK